MMKNGNRTIEDGALFQRADNRIQALDNCADIADRPPTEDEIKKRLNGYRGITAIMSPRSLKELISYGKFLPEISGDASALNDTDSDEI